MTEEDFLRIYQFMKKRYGIDMARKKEIVQGRLENYVRTNGFSGYGAMMDEVEADLTGKRENELVNLLTTNHTFFMREFEHFDFLRREVLPELYKTEAGRKDLCIWCGAASTGQEPYMLAMLLKVFFSLEHEQWDTKVLATDISTEALQKATEGRYDKEQIQGLPEPWKRRFFRSLQGGELFEVREEIKNEVLFREFNLMDEFPFKRKMHIVFLRNVMIYFDKETKQQLIQKVYDCMEPGGYLFIGRTEMIEKGTSPFQTVWPSVFRK